MEVRQLRYFVAVAEELNFTRAARRLHISQQSLSAAVQRLEAQLGCRLFERTSHRVELTRAGHALLARSAAVFEAVDAAVAAARDGAGLLSGRLTLRYGLDSQAFVEPALVAFGARHPDVLVQAASGPDADNLASLRTGQVDAVFAWALDGVAPDLNVRAVDAEETLLALPADHDLARLEAVPVPALADETLVLFPRDGAPAVWDLLRHALRPGSVVQTPVSGQETMVAAVARGTGLAPVSSGLAAGLARDDVAFRPLSPPVRVPLQLAWQNGAGAPLRALVEHLGAVGARTG